MVKVVCTKYTRFEDGRSGVKFEKILANDSRRYVGVAFVTQDVADKYYKDVDGFTIEGDAGNVMTVPDTSGTSSDIIDIKSTDKVGTDASGNMTVEAKAEKTLEVKDASGDTAKDKAGK